jgi:hypothetical protein
LSWATPKGWSEEKGSGMRMVTFRAQGKSGGIECSIVSLGGMAGGLESNVARWMGQLKVAVPPDDQLKAFLDRQEAVQTKGDFAVTLIDLTQYTQDAGAPSMIAGIARMPDMTVFVKMTGSRQAVTEQRQALRGLCASLSIN